MPKKTRKEKLLAQKRRISLPSHISQTASLPDAGHLDVDRAVFQFQSQLTKKALTKDTDDKIELTAIKTDLVKTLVLASIAIAVELTLYWLLRSK